MRRLRHSFLSWLPAFRDPSDLENAKNVFAALCPIHAVSDFERVNPDFAKKGHWEQVRRGRVEGLHMLASPEQPDNNKMALVVDFRQIFSLPIDYLHRHADSLGDRWRLQSPYLEHFSQAFARFFIRMSRVVLNASNRQLGSVIHGPTPKPGAE